MAKKDKEEEKKDVNQNSEEDFGLPDLEFEELDDLDQEESDEADMSNVEEEIADLIDEKPDEDELTLDDIGAENDEESVMAEATEEGEILSDIGSSPETEGIDSLVESSPPEEDSQEEVIDEELDEVEKFISEITADDDEKDSDFDEFDSGSEVIESSDEFASDTSSFDDEDLETSASTGAGSGDATKSFTRIIIFGLVGAVAIAFGFLYWHNQTKGDRQVAGAETPQSTTEKPVETEPVTEKPVETQTVAEKPVETQTVAEKPVETQTVAEKPVKTTPATTKSVRPTRQTASTGTPGAITVINSRANRYYIVVASFIDEDMANDMGRELVGQGVSIKILHPFNERKYYRVSVADYGTRQEAVNATDSFKPQYGDDVWALKY